MKKSPLLPIHHLIFTVICLIEIYSLAKASPLLEQLVKPLIMITITVYFIIYSRRNHRLFLPSVVAFLFSLAGDVLLMFSALNDLFFLVGLAAFLLSHLFYIITFMTKEPGKRKLQGTFGFMHLLVILSALLLYILLFPHLEGVMKIAVFLYTTAITTMVMTALERKHRVSPGSYQLVLLGALLFMISDSLLAVNRFWFEIPYSNIMVMATYMPAQYLIFWGLLKQSNAN